MLQCFAHCTAASVTIGNHSLRSGLGFGAGSAGREERAAGRREGEKAAAARAAEGKRKREPAAEETPRLSVRTRRDSDKER